MALSHMNFSGNEAQQRHVGYSNNYRQRGVNEVVVKDRSHHVNRPALLALKGKPWSTFTEFYGCESSDDESDGDTTDDDPLIASTLKKRHQKGFVVKLKNKDRALYGTCPETDPFEIVTCRLCKMVLKPPALKNHIERHEKEKKHERNLEASSSSKVERLEKISISSSSNDKTHSVTEKLDKISVLSEKYEKSPHATISSNFGGLFEKSADLKRQKFIMKKPATVSESSMDTSHYDSLSSDLESKRNRRKRKHEELSEKSSTFQASSSPQPSSSNTAACRTIIVDQSEIMNVIRDASSPPPLAPITSKSNEQTSVVVQITKFMPTTVTATVIDGSFVMQPLEQEETEIDLKDLKILKPIVKEPTTLTENQTLLTSSNFYASQPRPLAMNTFNLKKLNAQSYVMATQRKLVEFGRNLKVEEKVVGGKISTPRTWSFNERQVFIPFRITH